MWNDLLKVLKAIRAQDYIKLIAARNTHTLHISDNSYNYYNLNLPVTFLPCQVAVILLGSSEVLLNLLEILSLNPENRS